MAAIAQLLADMQTQVNIYTAHTETTSATTEAKELASSMPSLAMI